MKTLTVGEFKSRFSEALEAVRAGETIVVSYGRDQGRAGRAEKAAAPWSLEGQGKNQVHKDWAMTEEELLNS